jgi:hypothetical protein
MKMHMRKAIIRAVAPATLALILMVPGAAHARNDKAETACDMDYIKCNDFCDKISTANRQFCRNECKAQHTACYKKAGLPTPKTSGTDVRPGGGAGVKDTGGPKGGNNTSSGGGVATDPKSPPKGAGGTRAPLTGGVFNQSTTTGSGGSGPILKSGGSKR